MAQAFRPPATQRLYDVCIVGSQLGGAVAGALLARRGFRVLYIDHDGAGTQYEDGGYLLPHAPALIPAPRLLPAAEIALNELGFTSDLGRALETSTPGLQLLFPRNRLDLHADPAARAVELRREWPADGDALDAALTALTHAFDGASPVLKALPPLPPDGFLERRELSKAVRFGPPTSASRSVPASTPQDASHRRIPPSTCSPPRTRNPPGRSARSSIA